MPGWPWKRKATADPPPGFSALAAPGLDAPAVGGPAVAITAAGNRSVAIGSLDGDVYTGDVRTVHLAPGVVQPPDDIAVPAAGAHNLPRRPNPVFVGREKLLAQVAAVFAPPAAEGLEGGGRAAVGQAITGLGGIGKSELALQYAHRRTGPGAVVWWADAENAETLDLALADLAYRLQPAATGAIWTTTEAAAWTIGWLQAHTGWLLVLDNAEDPAFIAPLLGQLPAGDILITTRRDIGWTDHTVAPVTLDVLPRAASVELLRERLDNLGAGRRQGDVPTDADSGFDATAADALAAELGDLPLALQQAAGYLTAHQLPLATYLQRLRQQTGTLLGKTAPGADPHRAVARVFTLTIAALQSTAPAGVDLLCALAWLAPVPLPRQVTQPTDAALPDARGRSLLRRRRRARRRRARWPSAPDIDDLLGVLASYSLITLTPTTVAIHRLLQACLRDHDRATSTDSNTAAQRLTSGQATALAWLADGVPAAPGSNVAGWGLWRDLLPHLDALFDHLPPDLPSLDLADLLGSTGVYLWVQGRYADALPLQQRALTITEATLGPKHPDNATRLNNLAATLRRLGRHADALPLQQRALAIIEATLGPDHPDTATGLNNLGLTLGDLGRHADALPLQQRALAVTEATLGPDHPTTALRLNTLAGTLGDLGRHADALPLRQRALTITEATLGPDHPDTARRQRVVASTLTALRQRTGAVAVRDRLPAVAPPHGDLGSQTSAP